MLDFLLGGGEMGASIRAHDWSSSALGAPAAWPQSLRSALSICLNSSFPTAIYWGADLCLLYNDAWAPIPGERHGAVLGHPAREVWADIWAVVGPQLAQVQATGNGFSTFDQWLPMLRDGVVCDTWWNYSFTPIRGEAGEVAGIFNQGHETTTRVLGERQRAAEAAQQQRMFEQAPGFITVLKGPEHVYEFVNKAYRSLFGDRDFVGKTIRQVFPELVGQGFYEWLDRVYSTGERFVSERTPIWLTTPGQPAEQRYLDFIYEPLTDEQGRVIGIFCEGHDVTEAHLARAAMQASEQRLRQALSALQTLNRINTVLAGDLDLERVVQTVTDAGVELTGARFGAYFHNQLDESGERLHLFTLSGADREVFSRLGRPRATQVFAPTFNNLGVVRSDDIQQDPRYGQAEPHRGMPEGHLPVRSYLAVSVVSRSGEVQGGLFFGHPQPGQFTAEHEHLMSALAAQAAIAIDNARLFQQVQVANETLEQRVAERSNELTQAHEALRQAQKMEAVGQLTGGIAHDFNNLLAGIIGSLELLDKRLSQGRHEGVERFIKGAQTSAQRAAALTQRLLAFSRRQTLDPKPTDVNRLVFGMEDLIRRTVGPAINVHVLADDSLWPARIDAAQLESALLNLAINARDAMPAGGCIGIQTRNVELGGLAAKELDLVPGDYLCLAVSDSGTGIAEDIIARIFDPFFTTKPIGQGTGLGLSMIHGFVRQSGGQVQVHSRIAEGTTMSLYLPRHSGALADEGDAAHTPLTAGSGQQVLVIDDEETVRMLIVEVLEEAGYRTLQADNGQAGLDILRSSARVDLLVSDVGLPGGMNGRQVADAARVFRPTLKVLFVTGFAESAVLGSGSLDARMQVITKPFVMAELVARVAEMIDG
ncbi:PAS domain-containing protein [Pseudomonas sp. HR96]|uniref:GAF domain-containing protein n=1 Tax=Pseudomonas sp. HR96 TaxID=1027966 RepID=UPI002A764475|nr:GAF domain-containing protein [Pseudomonas sp. HR96]WPP01978.1 PAS domain-containing protein [Pseudomonas sp. HR96]